MKKTSLPIQPIYLKTQSGQIRSAGSSNTAPVILIFSIAMGAGYLSYVKAIGTFVLTFFGYIISVLASVSIEILQFELHHKDFVE